MRRLGPLLLLLACVAPAAAQEPGAIVRAHVEPAGGVMVGEPARVVIDVLTPTWFLSPPQFPALDVPGALVVFQERGVNLNESIEGTSYSGIQREYLVYPMREGRLSIPPFEVTVVYAIDTRPSMPTPLATQPISFEATVPAAARGLDSFVSALRLDLRQTLEPPPKGLAVGGALRRTVTIEAEGAFGMMLPPLPAPTIAGLSAYPDPPQVEDHGGERGEARVARRVESVAYRLEREGDYELPGIEVAWWDLGTKRMRKAQLRGGRILGHAGSGPRRRDPAAAGDRGGGGDAAGVNDHGGGRRPLDRPGPDPPALRGPGRFPPLARRLRRARARLARRAGAATTRSRSGSARVRRAAARGDAAATYRALLGWAQRCGPTGDARDVPARSRRFGAGRGGRPPRGMLYGRGPPPPGPGPVSSPAWWRRAAEPRVRPLSRCDRRGRRARRRRARGAPDAQATLP